MGLNDNWRLIAVLWTLLAVPGASPAADSRGNVRHLLQASSAATQATSAAAVDDPTAGDPITVVAPKWLSHCNADSSSTSWGMTLQNLQAQQMPENGGGATQECFLISRQMQCTASSGNPCCNPARGPSRVAIRTVPGLCSASLGRFSWSLDGSPLKFTLTPQGWLLSGRLGAWRAGQAAKQLCVQITPAAVGATDGCAALSDLCKGTNRCRYRLFSAAAAAASSAASAASSSGCCMESNTGDGALAGGDAQPLSARKAGSVNRLEDAFQGMVIAANQLRTAVKEGDAQMAANALKTPITASNVVKRLASERYAQGVIVAAEQPAAFDGTAFNAPVKSQGRSTMSASYAAVAALEATVAAHFFAGKPDGINFSEKAMHWCDAATPATSEINTNGSFSNVSQITPTAGGWYAAVAMATLAQYGAANTSCYGDAVGTQYPITELGNMQGSCAGVLASCGRLKGFRYIDLTPRTDPSRFTTVLEHIQKHHAVAARLQVTEEMLQQLTGLQEDGTMRRGASAAAAGDIILADLNSTSSQDRFGHVVAVVGYNFSSSNASQHYWLIKDSLPGVGAGQYWKLGVKSAVGMGAWFGGFSFTPGTGPDSVTLDPILSSPKPVDPSGTVKPTPIGLSPSPEPSPETSRIADTTADAARLSAQLAAAGGLEAAAAVPPSDGSTTGSTESGKTGTTVGSTESSTAGSSTAGASGTAANGAFRPPIVDPNRIRSTKHLDVNPDDLVLTPEERFRPVTQTLMSMSLGWLLQNDVLASTSSAGPVRPTDCSDYTTTGACERLSVIWYNIGGAAAGLRSLVGVLADNFEALSGKDITCLAAGTKLQLCKR